MKLSRFTDISLRALLFLGSQPDRVWGTADLARRLHVSKDHLAKSLQTLRKLGIVVSSSGRAGGFSIQQPFGELRLGRLVDTLEPSMSMAECFEPSSSCPLTGNCRLADALSQARRRFLDALDDLTLGDLIETDRPMLVQIGGTL